MTTGNTDRDAAKPRLDVLPSPPEGRTGWPWTEQCSPLSGAPEHGAEWPRITIVTPSYNQGQYIEETIRSILLQGYPNLEFIVIDGGSTDQTTAILDKYDPWIAYWESDPDEGQAHAINKGLRRGTGEIEAYLNSDDVYCPYALKEVAAQFLQPDVKWASACTEKTDGEQSEYIRPQTKSLAEFIFYQSFPQPSTFWRASLRGDTEFDESYNFCLDGAFFCELIDRAGMPSMYPGKTWAVFRVHDDSKTTRLQSLRHREMLRLSAEWIRRSKGLRRLHLKHVRKRYKIWSQLTDLMGRTEFTPVNSRREVASEILKYPPVLLNRRILGAIRRIWFSSE